MIPETIIILIIFAYIHKKIRFYFVLKKVKKYNPIMKGADPYLFIKSKKIGVLLLHGFTSTPSEVRNLADYLVKKNITVYAPLLKGHGTIVQDLARTKYQDWEKSALDGYNKLSKIVDKIYIAGSSVGGNLAFRIAAKKKVAGIIPMGTPMFFRRERYHKFLLYTNLIFRNFIKKSYKENEKEALKNKVQYLYFPLNCMLDIIKITRLSEKSLPNITAPALIMQSETDRILPIENVNIIYNKLGSKKKKICLVPDSYHVFCIDKNRDGAFKKIYEFIEDNGDLPASTNKA